ncbi:MAG TPA: hypothetical protein VHO67_08665 [Polyangia bacterium]|nr:hypothetical protein [Polyangia bacterium]
MGREDWYKRKTWTAADQRAFWARFDQSRSAVSKTQYLLIQAGSLLSTGNLELVAPALTIVDRLLDQHPHEAFLSEAHATRARCLAVLRQFDEALSSYRLAFDAQRARRGMTNLAHLEFAWLIVEAGRVDLYDEALQMLDEFSRRAGLFPLHAYQEAAARALMWSGKGENGRAAAYAREAIAASSKSASPFLHRRHLGGVNDIDQKLQARLFALAGAQPAAAADGASPRR